MSSQTTNRSLPSVPPAGRKDDGFVVAISGGVGGAKLALGLQQLLPAGQLVVVTNVGDDFTHFGLRISPDLDTVMYTLCGLDDHERGWGLANETWQAMAAFERLGAPTWFRLGDSDLATHLERTRRLTQGESLAAVTDELRVRLGMPSVLLPVTDDPVATYVRTASGWLDFQSYFVARQCEPVVSEIEYRGAQSARISPQVAQCLASPRLRGIVICPSNPLLSVAPMLAIPGFREALDNRNVPLVAVSPIIGGESIKGPTAKLMRELGQEPSTSAVARYYNGLIDGFIVDPVDDPHNHPQAERTTGADLAFPSRMRVFPYPILMRSLDDRMGVAQAVLDAFAALAGGQQGTPASGAAP